MTTPRALLRYRERIDGIELQAFGNASGKVVAAAVYAMVTQPSGINQGLVAAKARLAKQGLTILRLELISRHMVVKALEGFPVKQMHCWLDSSVALHWIRGAGGYKQFVGNRVQKIQEHGDVTWLHVGTLENLADLGSPSRSVENKELWWRGPEWLGNPERWSSDIVTSATRESQAEAKATRQIFAVAFAATDELAALLEKCSHWRTLRVCAWVSRFARNSRSPKARRTMGPLTMEEIDKQRLFWVKRVQENCSGGDRFEEDRLQLNLQMNKDEVLECRGRIQGDYPIYLPDTHLYTEKLVSGAHLATLHGGVGLTMARVRESYWVPRLRRLTKQVIKACYGCKRFRETAFASPPPGNLPRD